MTDAPPPFDVEIEQAVLGACLVTPAVAERLRPLLAAAHFCDPLHQRLYDAILRMSELGGGITPLTLRAALRGDPGLDAVGDIEYLSTLAEAAPALPDIEGLAHVLIDLAIRRALIRAGNDIIDRAHHGPLQTPITHQMQDAERELETARDMWERGAGGRSVRQAGDIGAESVARAESDLRDGRERRHIIATGLAKLNEKIGGFSGPDLVLVAGRPGMGKSALAGYFARAAAGAGYPTLVFSKEMSADQWVERTQCDIDYSLKGSGERGIHYSRFRTGTLSNIEIERLAVANRELQSIPLDICDVGDLTIADVAGRARAFKAKHRAKLGLIVVDYLQIIGVDDSLRGRSREQEVSAIARGLKSIAKRLGWPVVAACAIGRAADKREESDRRPTLSELRESGSLEQEADLVLMPYRKSYYIRNRKPEDPGEIPAWRSELAMWEHRFEILGPKFRHGSAFTLDDLYCDMGSSAIRDEKPYHHASQEDLTGMLNG
jgi:replicative DNA helicase